MLAVVVLLAALGIGGWRYAVSQWTGARADLDGGRPADARRRLEFCLRVWPRSPAVHLAAGRAARLTLDLPAAEAHLTRAIRLSEADAEAAQLELLLVRVQGGEVDEVAPALFAAVEAGHPQAAVLLETLSRAYMYQLRYKSAWASLSRWIEIDPNAATAYHWRAWSLERLSKHKSAMADYLRAIELDPGHAQARTRVAEMLLEDKQAPEAIPHLERLIRQLPTDPVVQARLGACRLLEGRLDEARTLLEAAAPHLVKDPALTVALANLNMLDGRGAEAEARLRAFLAGEPADTEALFVLAAAQRLQGKADEAATTLREYEEKTKLVQRANDLLTNVTDDPAAGAAEYAEIGRLLLEVGREKIGTYWLSRALERNPDHRPAHQALADYFERKGDALQAAVHRERLRPSLPGDRP